MSKASPTKILIVDDDASTRMVLGEMLAGQPEWEVVEASDGIEAWRLLTEGLNPGVCILDVNMPGLNGLELLEKIRASTEHKALRVILCTCCHDRATIERAAALTVDYFVLKPFKMDLLIAQVRQALTRNTKVAPAPSRPPVKTGLAGFVQQVRDLPSFSSVYQELAEVVRRPDSSTGKVSEIILQDQTLTSRLLKLANSVFYAAAGPVTTVDAAVQVVGMQQIQDLVLATVVIEAFDNVPGNLVDVQSFWKHSVATGLAAALLAECRNDPVPERFFIGGLLHDIGRLVLFTHAPEESRAIMDQCERTEQLPSKIEREVLGFDHAMVGAELLSSWNLPKGLVQMVACHHAPMKSSALLPSDTFLVHYADFITTALGFGDTGEQFLTPLVGPAPAERAFLEANPIETLVSHLEMRYQAVLPIYIQSAKLPKAG